jgi:hypothetical protein
MDSVFAFLDSVSSAVSVATLFTSVVTLFILLRQARHMARHVALASVVKMMDWMEEVRGDRLTLYELGRLQKPYEQWSDDEKRAAETVARRFDMLGVLESCGYLDQAVIDRFWAIPAHKVWEICKPHVREDQRKRGEHGEWLFWEFEQLADRVKHVEKNHPAIRGERRWKRHPRKLR